MSDIFGASGYSLEEIVTRSSDKWGKTKENRLWFVVKDGKRQGEGRQNYTCALEYARRLYREDLGIKQCIQPLNVSFFPR